SSSNWKALALPALRHKRNTQYGWVANPYPTGTFTLQDAPSFAWRANASHQPNKKHVGFCACQM
ncbi:MAG: hypothetical protein RPU91_17755, partial [Candidatus Sedimenticola sp. (ex Thyasira tokunagai)]